MCAVLFLFSISLSALAQEKLLTIDDIFDPVKKVNFSGTPANPRWLKDGAHYIVVSPNKNVSPRLLKVDAVTGDAVPFYDAAKMAAALGSLSGISKDDARKLANQSSYQMNPAETGALLNHANDLFYYEFGSDKAVRLTNSPDEEVGESFSPDGRMVSYVRNNNLYVVDISTQRERALTKDGSPKILNGRLDWVYQEELYGRGNFGAYWWSPDSTMLAYLRLDENPVHEFTVVDHIPYHQTVEVTPYPKAGDPNPLVQLGVVNAAGGPTRWVDTYKYQPADLLIVRVSWTPDGKKVVYQAQNREQTFLDLNAANPDDGKSSNVIQETSKAWVEVADDNPNLAERWLVFVAKRAQWLAASLSLRADGKLLGQVTSGDWDVRSIDGVDQAKGLIYLSGMEHSPIANQEYRIKMDGSGLTRVTTTEGGHRISANATANYFIDSTSDVNTPTQTRLYDADGKLVRVIDENKVDALKQYKLGSVEFVQVKTRDGFTMEAMMIKPPDFDPNKKYPVMEYTYSGPQAPQVRNGWGGSVYMWHQMLAQKGYIIWIL